MSDQTTSAGDDSPPAMPAQPVGAAAPAPDQPSQASTPSAPRRSRVRWAVAGVVALVVVAISALGLFALLSRQASSTVASWSPPDAVAYVELRADLPGDQRQNLAAFLAHFPGFADRSTLDQKIAETADRLLGSASDAKLNWSRDIAPWFGGQIGMSLSGLPNPANDDVAAPRELVVATQKDAAAASAWVSSIGGATPSTETYHGATLSTYHFPHGTDAAVTVTGGVVLAGDVDSVKAALDRNGANGLSSSATFRDAMASLKGDQLVRGFVDQRRYIQELLAGTPNLLGALGVDQAALEQLPPWTAFGARFEPDALAGQTVSEHTQASRAENRSSSIASHVPVSTVALVEAPAVGATLKTRLDRLRANPSLAPSIGQIDQAAGLLGGLDKLIGWIGDVGFVATVNGTTPAGGIVVVPTDQAQAEDLATSVKNILTLAGLGGQVKVSEESYGQGTITTVDLGDLEQLLHNVAGGSPTLPVGRAQISFSVQPGLVVVGSSPDFVKSIVDVKPGSSLADQPRYRSAMDRVGSRNVSNSYVDLAAIGKLLEPLVSSLPVGAGTYANEVQPYIEPLDIMTAALVAGSQTDAWNVVITVTKP